jgi:hypothetical protein
VPVLRHHGRCDECERCCACIDHWKW